LKHAISSVFDFILLKNSFHQSAAPRNRQPSSRARDLCKAKGDVTIADGVRQQAVASQPRLSRPVQLENPNFLSITKFEKREYDESSHPHHAMGTGFASRNPRDDGNAQL